MSNGRIGRMKARGRLTTKVLTDPALFTEVLRLEPFVRRAFTERYWLEDALEHKNELMSFFKRHRDDEALRVFHDEFNLFVELAGDNPRLPVRPDDINAQL